MRYGTPVVAGGRASLPEEAKSSAAQEEAPPEVQFSYEQLQRALQSLQLGFSPRDLADLVRLADPENTGSVTLEVRFVVSLSLLSCHVFSLLTLPHTSAPPILASIHPCAFIDVLLPPADLRGNLRSS